MNREEMQDFLKKNCMLQADGIALSGGGTADVYFDCKRALLRGEFLEPFSNWVLETAKKISPSPEIVGGPSIGADFIVAAVALRAAQTGSHLTSASVVRKEPKKHGTRNKIENEPEAKARVLVVEDVITTGGSIARACDEFLSAGHTISAIAAIIDRQAGGKEALEQKYGVPVHCLFRMEDFSSL